MWHIIDRFLIHVAASMFLTVTVFFSLKLWIRKNLKVSQYIAPEKKRLLVLSALIVFALAPLREPFDLYYGNQTVVKTIFDIISWCLGPGISTVVLLKFDKGE